MLSKKIMAALTAVLVLAAGCAPEGKDFWGNPLPTETPRAEVCDVATAAPPATEYDPNLNTRPSDITPGFSWIVFQVEVRAIAAPGLEICVPVEIYSHALSDEPDTLTLNKYQLPAGGDMTLGTTPFRGLMSIQYDPTEEQFAGKPPAWQAYVAATYLRTEDPFNDGVIFELSCTIKIAGASIARSFSMIVQSDETTRNICVTGTQSNSGWNHY